MATRRDERKLAAAACAATLAISVGACSARTHLVGESAGTGAAAGAGAEGGSGTEPATLPGAFGPCLKDRSPTIRRLSAEAGDGAVAFDAPSFTSDGSQLVAHLKDGSAHRLYYATRETTGELSRLNRISGLEPLVPEWPALSDLDELFFSSADAAGTSRLYVATLQATVTYAASPLPGDIDSTASQSQPSLTADRLAMLYLEQSAAGSRLREATRARLSPDAEWSQLPFEDAQPPDPPHCFAVTGDGLGLIYDVVSNGTSHVFYVARTARSRWFFAEPPSALPELDASGALTCVRAILNDGCRAYASSTRDGSSALYEVSWSP